MTRLHENVRDDFRLRNFQIRLSEDIARAHTEALEGGMSIKCNSALLQASPLELLHSDQLRPAYLSELVQIGGGPQVRVEIWTGVAGSSGAQAGWYIFCNGRLVLAADQSSATGWGEGSERSVPKYHPQYARFRGFVAFNSDDAGALPWNTTKTGVDSDSAIYKATRQNMVVLMRPVITFLNNVTREKDRPESERILNRLVDSATLAPIKELCAPGIFSAPPLVPQQRAPGESRIYYTRPTEKIEQAKRRLDVTTNAEVGERTFDYYYELECDEQ